METGLKIGGVALMGALGAFAALRAVRQRRSRMTETRHRLKWALAAAVAHLAARRFARRALMPSSA